ncbi:MAG: SigE family RNA polymerase sigma factor [Frankiales bacterium]|nr:SigE family RNA polymerase sigma factor [Frankiales bacterium]
MRGTSDAWGSVDAPPSRDAAVTSLFHAHYRRLLGLAGLLVDDRGTAEEVVQDAFERLYRGWGSLRDPGAAVAYLDRSVVNGARSRLRRRLTERSHRPPEGDPWPSAEATAVDSRQRDHLVAAVRQLPQRQREVIVLRYYLDLSEDQIAHWLGVSPGSVKKHAHRATTALQKRMEAWA